MAWHSELWRMSGRLDAFRYMVADRVTRRDLREAEGLDATGGTVTHNSLTALKSSARLPFHSPPDVGNDLLRVYSVSSLGGEEVALLHGTFVASRPSTQYSAAAATGELELYSLLKLLADSALEEPLALDAGADPVGAAALLASSCGLSVMAEESAMLLSSPRAYDAGECALDVVNDLMALAGFSSAGVDAAGNVRLERYRDPSQLSPVAVLADDEPGCTLGAAVRWELDAFDVPNKVIAVRTAAADEQPLVAVAVNDDPLSVFSTASRGRVVAHVEAVGDCDGLEALQALAERTLAQKSSAVESAEVSHPFLPYNAGDAIELRYTRHGLALTGVAVSKEVSLTPGMRCTTRIRRFVRM